jgi:ankyrin repeat protein
VHEPEWESLTPAKLDALKREALDPDLFNKKAKDMLFHYAMVYRDYDCLDRLSELKYRKADRRQMEGKSILQKYYGAYERDNVNALEKSIREYGVDYRDRFNRTPLHPAVDMGSKKILDLLLQYGANPSLADNLGKIPLQIALYQSYDSKDHFQTLKPLLSNLMTDHIKIMVDDRMIKIGNHKIEYFLLHFFIALQEDIIDECDSHFLAKRGVRAVDLERIVKEYPDSFLQEFRKKRSYLSSNLSKHELDSTNLYNKKLFKRIYTGGFYELNPDLAIWVNDQWISVYDIMQAEEVKVPTQKEKDAFVEAYRKQLREEHRRRREMGLLGGAWYDDDEYDDEDEYDEGDEYDDDDGYDEDEYDDTVGPASKRTKRNTDTQFSLPFDDA